MGRPLRPPPLRQVSRPPQSASVPRTRISVAVTARDDADALDCAETVTAIRNSSFVLLTQKNSASQSTSGTMKSRLAAAVRGKLLRTLAWTWAGSISGCSTCPLTMICGAATCGAPRLVKGLLRWRTPYCGSGDPRGFSLRFEVGGAALGWRCFGASDHGPVSYRRVGQSVDPPGKARRWGHDLRGSRQSGSVKPWSRPPQPRRTPSLASGG